MEVRGCDCRFCTGFFSRMTFSLESRVRCRRSGNVVRSEEYNGEAADSENGEQRTDSYATMVSLLAGERLLSVCQAPRSVPRPTPFKAKCGGSGSRNGEPALDHHPPPLLAIFYQTLLVSIMAPSATVSQNLPTSSSTEHTKKSGNGRAPVHISSAQVIQLEHEYGAHK